jgi:hypothetical protein
MKTRAIDCVIVDGLVSSCLTFDGPEKAPETGAFRGASAESMSFLEVGK